MRYKFVALPCESDAAGNVVRPYALDGEVIYKMSIENFLTAMGQNTQPEIEALIQKIEEKTGVLLTHDELSKALKDRYIDDNA